MPKIDRRANRPPKGATMAKVKTRKRYTCPHCGAKALYYRKTKRNYKCSKCGKVRSFTYEQLSNPKYAHRFR